MKHVLLPVLSLGLVHARPGCTLKDYKFDPVVEDGGRKPVAANSSEACRQGCVDAKDGCKFWTFFEKDAPLSCWHEKEGAKVIYAPGAIAGPAVCSEEPKACVETAPAGWPENYETAADSHKAWNGGYQPTQLQCWPLNDKAEVEQCADEGVKVVSDMATGWPGKCEYLFKMPDSIKDAETCEKECLTNSTCSVWQWTNANSCWQGVGAHCLEREGNGFNSSFTPVASQRMIHGTVRDLMSYAAKSLPEAAMVNIFAMTYWAEQIKAATTEEDREIIFDEVADACRNVCASHLYCSWWELDTKKGCFIEDTWVDGKFQRKVPYPVVKNSFTANADIFKGGLLQHVCKKPAAAIEPVVSKDEPMAVANTAKKEEGGMPWWGILLIVLGVIGILGVVIYAIMSGKKDPPRKKRALKQQSLDIPLAAEPTPVATAVAPLPTFQQFMPMPQLVQQAPQVRQFQPIQYTAAQPIQIAQPQYAQSTVIQQPVSYQDPVAYAARQPIYQQQHMQQGDLFRALDSNGDGVITRDELRNVMR